MPTNPNKLSKFWQELKRRKVVRVITVFAAAAFVILERRIASYISFAVIIGLIVLNIIPRSDRSDIKEILDKSVAVLPFIDDSPDKNEML